MKKAKRDGKDYKKGLLEWRNTPWPDGHSPAQKFFSRRTRTTMPTMKAQLKPKVVDGVPELIRERRQKSKVQYDKTAKVRPELEIGQQIRLQPSKPRQPWSAGSVAAKVGPRSFLVETEDGKLYRRNTQMIKSDKSIRTRKNLNLDDIPTHDYQTESETKEEKITPNQEITTGQEIQISEPEPSTQKTPVKDTCRPEPSYITRRGRAVIKPQRYRDD